MGFLKLKVFYEGFETYGILWRFWRDFDHDEVIFFAFYQNWVCLKKITNLGKSCQFGTTSHAQIVTIRHDSAMSYWSRANLARLLPCLLKSCQLDTTSVASFFFLILLFIYWVISCVMLKINLIHNFLRVLVLRNKNLDNRVWIMFG